MKKVSWLLAATFLLQTAVSAQSLRSATQVPWVMTHVHKYTVLPNSSDYHRKKSILYVSETEAVIPYYVPEKAKIVMGVKNEMNGLAKVNNKGMVKWQVELHNGAILGIARFHGNILVLSVPEWNDLKSRVSALKQIKATVLSVTNGRKLLEKDIPLTSTLYAQVSLHNDAAGEFQQLLVRHTKLPTSGLNVFSLNKHEKQVRQTESMQLYTISEDLALSQTASITITNPEQQYLASVTDAAGNLDVAWATASSLVLERYAPGTGTPAVKLSTPFEWNEKETPEIVLAANPARVDQAVLALRYKKGSSHIKTVQYDLAAQKTYVHDEEVEKALMKTIEAKAEVPEGRSREMTNKRFWGLKPTDIQFYGDKAIVVKQTSGTLATGPEYGHHVFVGDAFFTVLNPDGTVLKHLLLTKLTTSNSEIGYTLGTSVVGDALQFVTIDDVKISKSTLLHGVIDLKDMKWQKLVTVKGDGGVESGRLESAHTLWFASGPVIHALDPKGVRLETVFKVVMPK